jgi:hypothetical protein
LTLLPSPFEKLKVKKGVVVCGRIELSFGPIAGEVIDKIRATGNKVDMSVEQAILEAVRTLPFNKQQEIMATPPASATRQHRSSPSQVSRGFLPAEGSPFQQRTLTKPDARSGRTSQEEDI